MSPGNELVYFCGRPFTYDDEGKLVPCERSTGGKLGKYGEDTVTMRVPVSMVPLLQSLLNRIEEIEIVRRNIQGNVLNSTPELIGLDSLRSHYAADWRRAVAYSMKSATARVKMRKSETGTED